MIFMQLEILLLILSALLFAPEIAARIVKYYRAVIKWRDCVDEIKMHKDVAAKMAEKYEPVKYELVGTDFVKREKQDATFDFNTAKQEYKAQCEKPAKKPRPKAMTAPTIPKGFKRHDGGKRPVRKNQRVDYVLANGARYEYIYAHALTWEHTLIEGDWGCRIIAYRLSKRK